MFGVSSLAERIKPGRHYFATQEAPLSISMMESNSQHLHP